MSGAPLAVLALLAVTPEVRDGSLRGSPRSLDRQSAAAVTHGSSWLKDAEEVKRAVADGRLVKVKTTRDLALGKVRHPYARPALKLLLDRLAGQYRRACGRRLVVTSLVRPQDQRVKGTSPRTVHPTGMAADLRYSPRRRCRAWLEETLLYLERRALVEATREYTPPHYHLAVLPTAYEAHVKRLEARRKREAERLAKRRSH